ncbi:tripartite motif-containing protein 3 [Biomphalaria glabrata]
MSCSAAALAVSKGPETSKRFFIDDDIFHEQFLSCSVCHERYNQKERAPKLLICNHTFCLTCLLTIYDTPKKPHLPYRPVEDNIYRTLDCPMCRKANFLNRKSIMELPSDHHVVQMMDFLAQTARNSKQVCIKHDWQPVNFFCKKCFVPICRDCTVVDHKEVDGHAISDISKAMRDYSTELIALEIRSKDIFHKLKRRSDGLVNASKRLNILGRQIKKEIQHAFAEYQQDLQQRQESLTSKVTDMIKEQKSKIQSRFDSVCEKSEEVQKLNDEFQASRANNDVYKIFSLAQQIKNGEDVFSEMASLDDNELFLSFEFNRQGEGCFLTDLSDLGEIESKVDTSLKETLSDQELLDLGEHKEVESFGRLQPQLRAFSHTETQDYDSDEDDSIATEYDDAFRRMNLQAFSQEDCNSEEEDALDLDLQRFIDEFQE